MNQKLRAELRKLFQRFIVHDKFREFLPAVGNDKIIPSAFAAAKIQNEFFFANGFDQFAEPIPVHAALAENPARDDDVRRSGLKPAARVLRIDAAADLQSAWK